MNENKTHYRKAFDSPYLSAADLVEAIQLTVSKVILESDHTKKTKDMFNTAYFVEKELRPGEKLKPMILNAHNSKIMANLTGSKFIDDWVNIPVTIYVDSNVRFGKETVEGLRISPMKPEKKVLTPENATQWNLAKQAYQRDGNLKAVLKRVEMSQAHQEKLIAECSDAVV